MFGLKNFFDVLLEKYSKAAARLSDLDRIAVKGALEIHRKDGRTEYYLSYFDKDGVRAKRYLKVSELDLAMKVAQYTYNKKVSKIVEKRIAQLEGICRDFAEDELERVYEDLPELRKELVVAALPSWSIVLEAWMAKGHKENGFAFSAYSFLTKRGERVRSKSEKILADKFFDLGLAYKYECPVVLKDGNRYFPDFTFLHPRTLKEVYWEHFGMMDNQEYAINAINKIETYQRNGIILGKDLIVTFETSSHPLKDDIVSLLIEEFLL